MKVDKTLLYVFIFFVGYGIIQFIPTGGLSIPIPVPFGEAPPNYGIGWFNLSLSTFLDIVLAPPFMLIMFYFIHKAITEQTSLTNSKSSERKRELINHVLIWSGVVLIAGIIMHAVANWINGILGNPLPPGTPLEIAVYWFDEVLGHKLIHFAITGFLIGCMVLQYWHQRDPELSQIEVIGFYFWASIIGVIYTLAAAEGQAAFDLLIICSIVVIIILYYIKFKGLKLKENILTHFVLIFFSAIIITAIVYGSISGWLPGYPFIKQPPFT
ncbi:MAG: hypothetical protein HWN66_09735 [Candidatus Helarchaeota archaeon]|nr:hypothetical protein [Candidatus Helarchaeota archaeon]